jgi:hypothetical protein
MTRKTIQVLFSSFCPLLLLSVLWMFIGDGDESNLERANAAPKRGDATAEYFLARAISREKGLLRIMAKRRNYFVELRSRGMRRLRTILV